MKSSHSLKILLALLALLALGALVAPAQTADPAPAAQTAPAMTEDEPLPFMRTEAQPEMQEPGSGGLMIRALGSMILIVGLIFFAAWGVRKFGLLGVKPPNDETAPDLSVMTTVSLGGGRTISTVRFGERVLLVGSTAQSITLLAADDERAAAAFRPEPGPRSVGELLAAETNDPAESEDFGAQYERAQFRLSQAEADGGKI
jgi:flagellar biogenesis protein FliO